MGVHLVTSSLRMCTYHDGIPHSKIIIRKMLNKVTIENASDFSFKSGAVFQVNTTDGPDVDNSGFGRTDGWNTEWNVKSVPRPTDLRHQAVV